MTNASEPSLQVFRCGDLNLQSGGVLQDAKLAYVTLGKLNDARDNAVLLPTYYTGRHSNYLQLIGDGRALDPRQYFFIIPNMFGNGLSSSPSTWQRAPGRVFPRVSVLDNVKQQARLVFDHLQVRELALVCGYSMGGMQAYQWAASYPDRVRRLLAYCSAARTSRYNAVFLDGLRACLRADANWRDDHCQAAPEMGLRAFARVYAGWAYSEAFFRDHLYLTLGYESQEALLQGWEEDHLRFHANDLMAMLATWETANVASEPQVTGNFERALGSIRAATLLLPCSTDRYFPPEDNLREARLIRNCELRVLESAYGHCSLSPGRVAEASEFLEQALRHLLSH